MKKIHIFGILIIGVAIFILISTAGDASSYVSFDKAREMASDGSAEKIHVVGELKKNTSGEIIDVKPSEDKLSFSFAMIDENNREQRVYYNEPMPPDFLRSEKVVVIGSYRDDNVFVADKILLKCPSKYVEEDVRVSENQVRG